jgi:hemolysin activation/secretion protein
MHEGASTGGTWRPLALAAALALLSLTTARAQTPPPPLPSGAEPGREAPKLLLPPAPTGGVQISVPQAAATQAPAGADQLFFTLQQVVIEGASAFPAEQLKPLYAALLGQRISVAQAFGVAGEIELRYRNAGYVTSRVIVPQQTIDDGRFVIRVVEGSISDIAFTGEIGPARAALERLLAPLRGVRPISIAEIERRLLLADDLPGLTVRGTLEPSATELGGSRLIVAASRRASDVTLGLNNRNSPYMGNAAASAGVAWNAVGARADRLTLGLGLSLPTKRSTSVSVGYDALFSDDGATFGLGANVARSRPGRELEVLDVRSNVQSAQATVTLPLIRSRLQNLRAVGQFEVRNVDTDIAASAFTRDRLRIVRAGLSYDRSDRWDGINAARVTLHKGLAALGASATGAATASRVNGRSDFLKLTTEFTRLQQWGTRSSVLAALAGQWSRDPLLASEEMALGGPGFARGYDDSEISADNGVAASLELRHNPAWQPLADRTQVYAFVDGGRLRANSRGAPLTRAQTLASFGTGVRANLLPGVFATLEVAKPINAPVRTQGDKQPRVFMTLTAQF